MIPAELLKKIRKIHITTTRLVTELFAGEYKSVFKGKGLEFDSVREYLPGDDIRLIDWNVTARSTSPHIKKYVEERELTIMILLDASRSERFGSVANLKTETAAELASLLAVSANKNNDRVGLVVFTDRIEKFIPPRKGAHHILRIVREALFQSTEGRKTDIPMCLRYLDQVTTRRTIAFLISDFYAPGIKKALSVAGKRHDLIAVRITDARDSELPDVGIVSLTDAETLRQRLVDTSKRSVRERYRKEAAARTKELRDLLGSVKVDLIEIDTARPYAESLVKFFEMRKMRRKHKR
jgi:uncharacterized protein (DUF58 family)